MPGKRNYARERAAHAAQAPELQRQYAALLQHHDQALIGHAAILAFLHRLGIRRLNGSRLSWRIVNAWRRDHGCPILRGNHHALARRPALTTTAHLTAWLLSRFTAWPLFSVGEQAQLTTRGASTHASEVAA